MACSQGEAFVTLATNDSYAVGALVLAQSLRIAGTTHDLVVMITPGVSQGMREHLGQVYTMVHPVDVMDSKDEAHLAMMTRPELGVTLTKLHVWTLVQYSKCVFMDADTLVLANIDDLFEREQLSAAVDIGWPDCFNSGVFVMQPSLATFHDLVAHAIEKGSFDGGDQGLLNTFFGDWGTADIKKHLPFIYNMTASSTYTYLPAYKQFGKGVKVVHFLGSRKPWHYRFNAQSKNVEHSDGAYAGELLQQWWNVFACHVQPKLDPWVVEQCISEDSRVAPVESGLSHLNLSEDTGLSSAQHSGEPDREAWEHGQVDYLGADAFSNIQSHLDTIINGK
ncbi:PREDICTED: glycogenin-1-like isoform X2 [Priapulus caudatus]|uniref:glycogenin glucosyltransferase n=1 Tax=Priapulus caudatus TaxID=37621 RepID=A0ABM1DSJ2_PRICU|nr:PREDICTED: glycogenin-1-like isoform X2 [Priapulus caudatus]